MAWRPHGRARVNPENPEAFGYCDRCGFVYNLRDLDWQWDWNGNRLFNKRILVSHQCMDKPQEQLRPKGLPQDPVPILNPRPGDVQAEMGPQPAPVDPAIFVEQT